MMKRLLLLLALAVSLTAAQATDFEPAAQAVKNMGIGWNLGNSLESNSAEVDSPLTKGVFIHNGSKVLK